MGRLRAALALKGWFFVEASLYHIGIFPPHLLNLLTTINRRLAAIQVFYAYLSYEDTTLVFIQ